MRRNFTARVPYYGKSLQAVILPEHRKDGMYYEVNIPGFDRFYMHWTELDRYDVAAQEGLDIPDELAIAVSDIIEEKVKTF